MHHLAKFHRNRSNGRRDMAIWICRGRIGTTYDDCLVVSIVVQNMVEIDAVVSII